MTSILFLSSREGEEDKIKAQLSGEDDSLTKPFSHETVYGVGYRYSEK